VDSHNDKERSLVYLGVILLAFAKEEISSNPHRPDANAAYLHGRADRVERFGAILSIVAR
jgi:hypothetical protein